MLKLISIVTGGAIGTVLRYGASGFISKYFDGVFPWGTLVVNLIGCFLIGLVWEISANVVVAPSWRAFVFIGLLGAFTTFSTFGLETMNLLRAGEIKLALVNICYSNGLGFVLVLLVNPICIKADPFTNRSSSKRENCISQEQPSRAALWDLAPTVVSIRQKFSAFPKTCLLLSNWLIPKRISTSSYRFWMKPFRKG